MSRIRGASLILREVSRAKSLNHSETLKKPGLRASQKPSDELAETLPLRFESHEKQAQWRGRECFNWHDQQRHLFEPCLLWVSVTREASKGGALQLIGAILPRV